MLKEHLYAECLYMVLNRDKIITQKKIWNTKVQQVLIGDIVTVKNVLKKILHQQHQLVDSTLECRRIVKDLGLDVTKISFSQKFDIGEINTQEYKIFATMLNLIVLIQQEMTQRTRGYKKRINLLYRALHNLPKCMIDKHESIFYSVRDATTIEDSLNSCNWWVNEYMQKTCLPQ